MPPRKADEAVQRKDFARLAHGVQQQHGLVRTTLKGDGAKATFEPIEGPSIVICTSGKGTIAVGSKVEEVGPGYVFFVGASAELVLESKAAS